MTAANKEVDKTKSQNLTKSTSPFISMITGEKKSSVESDAIYDTDTQIKQTQDRIWKALKRRYQYDSNLDSGQNFLKNHVNSKIPLVILYVDLVGSTKMSITLSIDKLSAIIRAFAQEISSVISSYGGYVLKYIGDAVLAYFVIEKIEIDRNGGGNNTALSPYSLQITNAISYAYTMIKVIQNIDELDGKAVFTRPHIDLIGSTISIVVKMTSIAKPDQIIIGQKLYDKLDEKHKQAFRQISGTSSVEDYISEVSDRKYHFYASVLMEIT